MTRPSAAFDHVRLDRLAAALPPALAADLRDLVADLTSAPWQRRRRQLAARDDAVRLALLTHADLKPCRAAEALASELTRAAACPHARGERADLLRRILTMSNGKALAWRRIVDIAEAADLQ